MLSANTTKTTTNARPTLAAIRRFARAGALSAAERRPELAFLTAALLRYVLAHLPAMAARHFWGTDGHMSGFYIRLEVRCLFRHALFGPVFGPRAPAVPLCTGVDDVEALIAGLPGTASILEERFAAILPRAEACMLSTFPPQKPGPALDRALELFEAIGEPYPWKALGGPCVTAERN